MSVVIWHDVECGAYAADLPLWRELAETAAGPVLELGAGTGRVARDLACRGHPVTALDSDRELLVALEERCKRDGLVIETIEADARDFSIGARFGLVLAPMQLAQLFDPAGRDSMLASVAAHLEAGGVAAFALVSGEGLPEPGEEGPEVLPDVRELDGWVYSSLPLAVRSDNGAIEIRRLRQAVSPAGELSEELDVTRLDEIEPSDLEAVAARHGLVPLARREVPATDDHAGSVAVVLQAPR